VAAPKPSCFIAGEHDFVRDVLPGIDLFESPGAACADFRGSTIVQGAGHWVQQEAPAAVNQTLDAFLQPMDRLVRPQLSAQDLREVGRLAQLVSALA
jgi:alpha-beta hydrolase superfamily lysophospholipase